jgi:hypothetical protein
MLRIEILPHGAALSVADDHQGVVFLVVDPAVVQLFRQARRGWSCRLDPRSASRRDYTTLRRDSPESKGGTLASVRPAKKMMTRPGALAFVFTLAMATLTGGALVAQEAPPAESLRVLDPVLVDRDTAGDAFDVRMRGIDAAVDDRDADAATRERHHFFLLSSVSPVVESWRRA